MTSDHSEQSELEWLAFQYVAGELPGDDAAGFEERLATDQLAREAVARAVELADIAMAAEIHTAEVASCAGADSVAAVSTRGASVPATSAGIRRSRRFAWIAWGTAASLLLMVLVQQWRWTELMRRSAAETAATSSRSIPSAAPGNLPGNLDSSALALAWAQARSTALTDDSPETAELPVESPAEIPAVVENSHDEDGLAAPSWMLVAVAGLGFGEQTE
jgi:hypothetical protein